MVLWGHHRHVSGFCPKPWGLWGPQAVGMREVGRTEFPVSFKSPALLGGGALLSSSHAALRGTGTRQSQSF